VSCHPAYAPRFSYTHEMVNHLMEIEGARRLVDVLVLPPDAAFMLKYDAQRRSTRYSTGIEGNTIRLETIREGIALADRTGSQQQQEVRNYWMALEWLDRRVEENGRFSEEFVRRLHRIIIVRRRGRRGEMSDYRTEECPVVDAATGLVDYGPPRPEDVPCLMAALVEWRNSPAAAELPGPVRAGVLAYQFVTIHPFADGNGRTARALATAELWFSGYRMRGFLSVGEEYFRDLPRYYDSLQMGHPMDYYEGRNDPDLTPWLSYFVETMATAAGRVRDRALKLHEKAPRSSAPWEELDRRQQQLLSRLVLAEPESDEVPGFTAGDVSDWFSVSLQTARAWLREWHEAGLVLPSGGRVRVRAWRLSEEFAALVRATRSASREGPIA
jgi:Fic family protein